MPNMTNEEIIRYVLACRDESKESKATRMEKNKENYDMYNMVYDFSHKTEGQSQEVLGKTRMAVEQIAAFFQQALVDMGDWFKVEPQNNTNEELLPIKAHEVEKMTSYMLDKANYFTHIGNSVKSGILGSLIISKTDGELVPKPKYIVKNGNKYGKKLIKVEDKTWQLKKTIISQENWYPDPNGNLYRIEECYLDLYVVKQNSDSEDSIYKKSAVNELAQKMQDDQEEIERKQREEGKDPTVSNHRPRVKITEFWGNILDNEGNIAYENVVVTIADDRILIRPPEDNPLWHQETPFTEGALLDFANTKWPQALADAGVKHEKALTEVYNLAVDASMRRVHSISQIRLDWLADPSQVANGIPPGTALKVSNMCPPGAKVMEPVVPTEFPPEVFNMHNVVQQEFNASMLTSDIRMGMQSFRQVKATEIVETNQTITSVFQGMAKNLESRYIQKDLERSWQTICQNWSDISIEEFKSLYGDKRGAELAALSPEEVFASTVSGIKFKVFGISLTINKQLDFRKWAQLLQTISSSEVLMEAFIKVYSFENLLGEIMGSLSIDKAKIKRDDTEASLMAQGGAPDPMAALTGAPNMMSQISQAGAGNLADIKGGPQQASFPGSPATAGGQ